MPRKERAHRCVVVVTEFCPGGTLREAVARGMFSLPPAGGGPRHGPAPDAPPPPPPGGGRSAAAVPGSGNDAPTLAAAPDVRRLRAALLQVARGMHFLHSHGIVHGELRADNILLTRDLEDGDRGSDGRGGGGGGEGGGGGAGGDGAGGEGGGGGPDALPGGALAKLKDVGLCTLVVSNRALSLRKLAGRARLHAVGWLPPECFQGEGIGRGADVYAFGILMWELLTGQVRLRDWGLGRL
jgi:serine/threonine protein kinase